MRRTRWETPEAYRSTHIRYKRVDMEFTELVTLTQYLVFLESERNFILLESFIVYYRSSLLQSVVKGCTRLRILTEEYLS